MKPPPAERLRRAYLHLLHSYSHQQNPIYIGFSLLRTRRTILGLLPLITSVIKGAMSTGGLSFTEVLGGGELFIVGAVIAAGAMGELFAGAFKEGPSLLTILAGFWTLLAFAANTMAYMAVSTAPQATVVHLSLGFFPFTLLASGLSVGTAATQ